MASSRVWHLRDLQLCSLAQVQKQSVIWQCVREHNNKQDNTNHLPIWRSVPHTYQAKSKTLIHRGFTTCKHFNSRPPCGIRTCHTVTPATFRLFRYGWPQSTFRRNKRLQCGTSRCFSGLTWSDTNDKGVKSSQADLAYQVYHHYLYTLWTLCRLVGLSRSSSSFAQLPRLQTFSCS